MEFIALFLVIIVLLILFTKANKSAAVQTPYELSGPLFTPAERSFYGVLNLACDNKVLIFGKVRIADVLKPKKGLNTSQWQTAFNKISAKHFDFVLCNPDDLSIFAVIELDDKSHSQKKQIVRDQFVESSCNTAGLKLHRFKASASYSVEELKNKIFNVELTQTNHLNSCPKCASELSVKTAQKGKNKGNKFLACTRFPKCRYTKDIEV
tara:strand:+ start:324 stop:950 length:627 start_codon:yes stop_codon:yes gene_type:complete